MKIMVEQFGVIHYYAQCEDCSWDAGITSNGLKSKQDVRNAIRKHIRKTRHTVSLESGTATLYTASSDE